MWTLNLEMWTLNLKHHLNRSNNEIPRYKSIKTWTVQDLNADNYTKLVKDIKDLNRDSCV